MQIIELLGLSVSDKSDGFMGSSHQFYFKAKKKKKKGKE